MLPLWTAWIPANNPSVTGSVSPSYRGVMGNSGLRWNARADVRFESDQWLDSANIARRRPVWSASMRPRGP